MCCVHCTVGRWCGPSDADLHQVSVDSSWYVMAHGEVREGKWRGNWRMEWIISTLHTTSEHGVSSITTADAHTSAASSRLNWRPRRFKWTSPFRLKTRSGFCACAITFQLASTVGCQRRHFTVEEISLKIKGKRWCCWLIKAGDGLRRCDVGFTVTLWSTAFPHPPNYWAQTWCLWWSLCRVSNLCQLT